MFFVSVVALALISIAQSPALAARPDRGGLVPLTLVRIDPNPADAFASTTSGEHGSLVFQTEPSKGGGNNARYVHVRCYASWAEWLNPPFGLTEEGDAAVDSSGFATYSYRSGLMNGTTPYVEWCSAYVVRWGDRLSPLSLTLTFEVR